MRADTLVRVYRAVSLVEGDARVPQDARLLLSEALGRLIATADMMNVALPLPTVGVVVGAEVAL